MRKFFLLVGTSLCIGTQLHAQQVQPIGMYGVMVGSFEKMPASDYFKNLSNVTHEYEHELHNYYLGRFSTKEEAEAAKSKAVTAGYKYARIVDWALVRSQCNATCSFVPHDEPQFIKSLFFDYDKANLRQASIVELDKLVKILKENPTYTTVLSAHTDAHGSDTYNDALSQRRANSAKEYLLQHGIDQARIKATTSGEKTPIAKNEQDGKDEPQGRQFNRRVEISVLDGSGKTLSIVENINVPGSLHVQ
jgi:outer membrane protein OmpA-like peptidoglycan-associated protein